MKRVVIASVMVCFILITAIGSNIIINKKLDILLSEITETELIAETMSDTELLNEFYSLSEIWKETEKILKFFDSHDKYEDISKFFSVSDEKYKQGYSEEIIYDIIELKSLINQYIGSRKLNFQNIL